MLIKYIFYRIYFILKFKTFNKAFKINSNEIVIPTSMGFYKIFQKCPHQGAPLEKSFISNNILTCHWHGCAIDIFDKGKKYENN